MKNRVCFFVCDLNVYDFCVNPVFFIYNCANDVIGGALTFDKTFIVIKSLRISAFSNFVADCWLRVNHQRRTKCP